MNRSAAILGSLFAAPIGPALVGRWRWAFAAFALDVVVTALGIGGALLNLPILLLLALLVAGINRGVSIYAVVALPPQKDDRALPLIAVLIIGEIGFSLGARALLVQPYKIPAGSMIPTLQIGDHIFVDKRKKQPQRGDVIVFIYPREPDKDFIKRVLAVGGDTIEWNGEQPILNNKWIPRRALSESCRYHEVSEGRGEERDCHAFEETLDGRTWKVIEEGSARSFKAVVVPPGHYYVIGDNRDNSHDSRYWGMVPAANVKGTAVGIWWSSDDRGTHGERIGLPVK